MSGMTSTGRGGAGNIADSAKSPRLEPTDLETPTLKTSVITTGRGGSGNMTRNQDPAETRARQDVGPIERRPSTGATHVGRGGAANISKPKSPEPKSNASDETAIANDAPASDINKKPQPSRTGSGLAAKAKDFFKLT
ncbi:hypothetical protein SAMD00023353_0302990 [Rosellinia necatrix]|uniref:Uncharacterized protein n=1 Tax=Rosellinia necatrix TaxID=77044 RepID=A0A1W2TDV0_ROSNE|nr:hypothetical protein SAMD00023353_0302990 [Rosellinia necatrix]